MTAPADRKPLLSALWIFTVFNYLYADLLMMIVNPATYQRAAAKMTTGTVMGFTFLMEVLIAMVLLSRVLPYRANRSANIIAGRVPPGQNTPIDLTAQVRNLDQRDVKGLRYSFLRPALLVRQLNDPVARPTHHR